MIDLLRIYEKYFHENLDIYEKEIELMDIKGVALATNRNIENFIYALNVMLYVIELLLNSIQNNIQTLVSQAARKNVLEECQNNIRDFLEKENIVESLLFACFVKKIFQYIII